MTRQNADTVEISSNGSKWLGQEPDTVEQLIEVLRTETLDPTFEDHGYFAEKDGPGRVRIFGNFLTCSHVFNIRGPRKALAGLIRAIKKNTSSVRYSQAMMGRAVALPDFQSDSGKDRNGWIREARPA